MYAGLPQGELDRNAGTVAQSGTNPKAQITFRATRDAMLYLLAAKGFCLGGITEPVPMGNGPFASNCASDLAKVGYLIVPFDAGETEYEVDVHLWTLAGIRHEPIDY